MWLPHATSRGANPETPPLRGTEHVPTRSPRSRRDARTRIYTSPLIGKGIVGLYRAVRKRQPSQYLLNHAPRGRGNLWLDCYMLAWTAVLLGFWTSGALWTLPLAAGCVMALLAAVRWTEIIGACIELASRQLAAADPMSALGLVALYVVQSGFIVAVVLQTLIHAGWADYPQDMPSPHHGGDSLFLSWRIIASFGSTVSLRGGAVQLTAFLGGATGLLLVALVVAYGVGQLSAPTRGRAP